VRVQFGILSPVSFANIQRGGEKARLGYVPVEYSSDFCCGETALGRIAGF
jgi:hypothetical protein